MIQYLVTFIGLVFFLYGLATIILRKCDTSSKKYSDYGIVKSYVFTILGTALLLVGLLAF